MERDATLSPISRHNQTQLIPTELLGPSDMVALAGSPPDPSEVLHYKPRGALCTYSASPPVPLSGVLSRLERMRRQYGSLPAAAEFQAV